MNIIIPTTRGTILNKPQPTNAGMRPKPHMVAIGLIALLLLCVAAGASYLFWSSYRDTSDATVARAMAASQVVSTNVGWASETARLILQRVDDTLGPDLSKPPAELAKDIGDAIVALPGHMKLYVVDAGGTTRLTTDSGFQPIDVRDREYFAAIAGGESWHVTPLMISRLNGDQIFTFSKRISRNGVFAGVAILSISSDFLKQVWQSLSLDEQSTVGLFRDDGQLISRYPLPEGPMDLSKYVLFTDLLPNAETGTYNAVSPADGINRVVGYRRVPGTNLVALSSISTQGAFAGFRATTIGLLLLAVPAAIALVLIAFWTFRLLNEDARQRTEEAQFRTFAEAMPNHVWTSQPDGMRDWFNSRIYEFSGVQHGKLDGHSWVEIVHPDERDDVAAKWRQSIASGQPYEAESRLLREDGEFLWHISRAVPIQDEKGRISRWIGSNTDIDEQKRFAQALAESESRLRLAIEAGQLAVWEIDVQTLAIAHSAELNRLYGFPEDATPTLAEYQSRYAPGELERVARLSAEAEAHGEKELEIEVRHLWPDGAEKWLLIRAHNELNADGTGRVIGVVIDITERKHVEQALVESERRFRLSQEAAGIASLELDIASGNVIGSERFWNLWGLSARESVHISVLEQIVIPEDKDIRSNPETRKAGTAAPAVEYRIKRPDTGEIRWLSRHIEFISDDTGKPLKMFGVMQDITAQKEIQSRQEMLTRELEHRIKNILALVSAIASQTLKDSDIDSAREAFIERLVALSNAHEILTRTNWTEASMSQVIRATIAPLPKERIHISGPEIALEPKLALSMALAVNELGTNALKYGALSNGHGHVDITWSVDETRSPPTLTWQWREVDGPMVAQPTRRGFGSFLIARVLGPDFGGKVQLDYLAEGLQATLVAPLPSAGG
jgi:PAS domain S-box-containing protein